MNRLISVLIVCVVLPGCASLVSNSAWPVFFENRSGPAEFVIKNKNEVEMARGQTPATIILPSGAGYFTGAEYTVNFSKAGYQSQDYLLPSFFNGWYLGNLFNFIGFFIDPATGAMWRLDNELIVSLPEIPPPPPMPIPRKAPVIKPGL